MQVRLSDGGETKARRGRGGGSDGSSPILRQLAALARLYATVTPLCCTTASVGPTGLLHHLSICQIHRCVTEIYLLVRFDL